jgi:hypothetical protein
MWKISKTAGPRRTINIVGNRFAILNWRLDLIVDPYVSINIRAGLPLKAQIMSTSSGSRSDFSIEVRCKDPDEVQLLTRCLPWPISG